jgi:hypothetical protein
VRWDDEWGTAPSTEEPSRGTDSAAFGSRRDGSCAKDNEATEFDPLAAANINPAIEREETGNTSGRQPHARAQAHCGIGGLATYRRDSAAEIEPSITILFSEHTTGIPTSPRSPPLPRSLYPNPHFMKNITVPNQAEITYKMSRFLGTIHDCINAKVNDSETPIINIYPTGRFM